MQGKFDEEMGDGVMTRSRGRETVMGNSTTGTAHKAAQTTIILAATIFTRYTDTSSPSDWYSMYRRNIYSSYILLLSSTSRGRKRRCRDTFSTADFGFMRMSCIHSHPQSSTETDRDHSHGRWQSIKAKGQVQSG